VAAGKDLIAKAAAAVRDLPKAEPRSILVDVGRIDVKRGGTETHAISTYEESPAFRRFTVPDLLGYLQNRTELTRSTLLAILKRSGRLDDVFVDAQRFLDAAAEKIQEELHSLLVGGIRYEKLDPSSPDSEWEMTSFKDDELFDYLSSLEVNPGKSIYDFVTYDSEVERAFAKKLNDREDIRLFVKLPSWFVIDTPVGTYNPDWAIVKHHSTTVYMVRETKATKDFRMRRGIENETLRCGERHFDALGVSFDVVVTAEEV
jgi:type III restriction enzyme